MEPSIRLLDRTDLVAYTQLIRLFEAVFEWEDFELPDTAHLQRTLDAGQWMVWVAERDGEIVGGLTAIRLDLYSDPRPSAYLYDFAVATDWQRQGIGRRLMTALLDHCRAQGYALAFVQADVEDTHALEFYQAMRPSEVMHAQHFTYSFDDTPAR